MDQQTIAGILTLLKRSKELESVERYSASLRAKHNTVAEHSWRLALMVLIIGAELDVEMDMTRALSLALTHDLAEAVTGDTDAYTQIVDGKEAVQDKSVLEELAMRDMTGDLKLGNRAYALWREYEDHTTLESKFVHALDAIEGFLHIAESGVEAYVPKEFYGDYADASVRAFDDAAQKGPQMMSLLDVIKSDLRHQFAAAGVKWVGS